jgi:hypothetical protein
MPRSTSASKPKENDKRREQIVKLVEGHNLTRDPVWRELVALSSETRVEALEVDPEGVVITGESFEGVMNIYLKLEYAMDSQPNDAFTTSDSVLGKFKGHFERGNPKLDEITVETSPFYE